MDRKLVCMLLALTAGACGKSPESAAVGGVGKPRPQVYQWDGVIRHELHDHGHVRPLRYDGDWIGEFRVRLLEVPNPGSGGTTEANLYPLDLDYQVTGKAVAGDLSGGVRTTVDGIAQGHLAGSTLVDQVQLSNDRVPEGLPPTFAGLGRAAGRVLGSVLRISAAHAAQVGEDEGKPSAESVACLRGELPGSYRIMIGLMVAPGGGFTPDNSFQLFDGLQIWSSTAVDRDRKIGTRNIELTGTDVCGRILTAEQKVVSGSHSYSRGYSQDGDSQGGGSKAGKVTWTFTRIPCDDPKGCKPTTSDMPQPQPPSPQPSPKPPCDPELLAKADREYEVAAQFAEAGQKELEHAKEIATEVLKQYGADFTAEQGLVKTLEVAAERAAKTGGEWIAESSEVVGIVYELGKIDQTLTGELGPALVEERDLEDAALKDVQNEEAEAKTAKADLDAALAQGPCVGSVRDELNKLESEADDRDKIQKLVDSWQAPGSRDMYFVSGELADEGVAVAHARAIVQGARAGQSAQSPRRFGQVAAALVDMRHAAGLDSRFVRSAPQPAQSSTRRLSTGQLAGALADIRRAAELNRQGAARVTGIRDRDEALHGAVAALLKPR